MTWQTRSTVGITLGLVFIIVAFAFMGSFFKFISLDTPDRLTVWLGIVITCFLFFMGFYSGFNVQTKEAIAAFLVFFIWSFGLLLIPVPEGYGEAVLGSWAILLMAIFALYAKYKESKKKKNKHNS